MSDLQASSDPGFTARRQWFLVGARTAFSLPGLILMSASVGFAGLANEAGMTLAQVVFMTGVIWALPGQVVLVGAIISGASLPAATFAVTLSSVRLMPMVAALLPELRSKDTPRWVLYGLAHFIAVTSWVLAMERLRSIPPACRTSYYFGLGGTLVVANMVVVGAVFSIAGALPPMISAALLLLTPVYFLTSLWGSVRERAGHLAMVFGLVLGPLFHTLIPRFDLLAAGLIGGGAAYGWHRSRRAVRR